MLPFAESALVLLLASGALAQAPAPADHFGPAQASGMDTLRTGSTDASRLTTASRMADSRRTGTDTPGTDSLRVRLSLASQPDTLRRRQRAYEYSEAYGRRVTFHRRL